MIIDDLINSPVAKYNTITRFQGNAFIGDKESIAQHSFWVVIITDVLFENIFPRSENYGYRSVVEALYIDVIKKSIYHEFDETLLENDITHPVKHDSIHSEELRRLLKKIIKDHADKNNDVFTNEYKYNYLKQHLSRSPKKDEFVEHIVKVADWISFIMVCINQYNVGNQSVKKMMSIGINKCVKVIDSLRSSLEDLKIPNNGTYLSATKAELELIKNKY